MRLGRTGLATALALTLSLMACGGETDPVDAADAMVDTYTLQTVDGDPLPASPFPEVTITAGQIVLQRDRSYVATVVLEQDDETSQEGGTWILNQDELILSPASTSSSSETLLVSDGGHVLTLDEGFILVFRR